MVEEISATSEALDAEAEKLRNNVSQFKVDKTGNLGRKTMETQVDFPRDNGITMKKDMKKFGQEKTKINYDSLEGF